MTQPKQVVVDSSVVVHAFDTNSLTHENAHNLIEAARAAGYVLVMPMHGFFEIRSALRRIVHVEGKPIHPPYTGLVAALPLNLVAIDLQFVEAHKGVDVPYTKAGDTIFLVMAKKAGIPLISDDKPMLEKAKVCGIQALSVEDGLAYFAA